MEFFGFPAASMLINLYDVFRDRSRKISLGVQESVRNSIAELLLLPFIRFVSERFLEFCKTLKS